METRGERDRQKEIREIDKLIQRNNQEARNLSESRRKRKMSERALSYYVCVCMCVCESDKTRRGSLSAINLVGSLDKCSSLILKFPDKNSFIG